MWDSSVQISRSLLTALGTRRFLFYQNRIPLSARVLLVSNHRSFMDALLLISAMDRPVHFACHHYMGEVPLLRELVSQLGAFPLPATEHRQQGFFEQASRFLCGGDWVGVFPEGASPMLQLTRADEVGNFHRGFAHLALRVPVSDLVLLPVAICACEEVVLPGMPVRLLSFFDSSEPQFQQEGLHPVVVYKRVNILIGQPLWITAAHREAYQGRSAKRVIEEIAGQTRSEIAGLVRQGFY